MLFYEESKHLPPKYSCAVKDLALFYQIFEKKPVNVPSTLTLNSSQQSFDQLFEPFSKPTSMPHVPKSIEICKQHSLSPPHIPTASHRILNNSLCEKKANTLRERSKVELRIPLKPSYRRQPHIFSNNNVVININKNYNIKNNDYRSLSAMKAANRSISSNGTLSSIENDYNANLTNLRQIKGQAKHTSGIRLTKPSMPERAYSVRRSDAINNSQLNTK